MYPIYSIETDYNFGRNPDNLYALIIKTDEPIETLGVKLMYDVLGDDRQSDMAEIKVENSVSRIVDGDNVPVAFYSFDGIRLQDPQGACIIRYSDGTVRKVVPARK